MIITFATQKGGTGKTTLAIAFANYISAISERKINVFDFDYQKSFYYKWKDDELSENPTLDTSIGKDCYKIRVAITSKGKGKRGGARLITYVRILKNTVFLMDIYDKSEQSDITGKELEKLIEILSNES